MSRLKTVLKGENGEDPEPYVFHLWREFRYRKIFPVSHEEFLDESRDRIEWFLSFENLTNELRNDNV